jgi:hypothetical protein
MFSRSLNRQQGKAMKNDGARTKNLFLRIFLGLIVAYAAIGLIFGLFGPLLSDLLAFVTGDYAEIRSRGEGTPMMLANTAAMAALTIPLMAIPATIARRFIMKNAAAPKKKAVQLLVPQPGAPPPVGWKAVVAALHKIAAIVLFEEFYTRWFFLGALTSLAWLDGPIAFYALFLISNGAWALVHLTNFSKGARNPLRVVPQFILGFPTTVMFLRYGLPGAFAGHFIWNMVPLLPQFVVQARRGVPLTLGGVG